jgi:hypothetical protein
MILFNSRQHPELSNFFVSPLELHFAGAGTIHFRSVECAFQAMKVKPYDRAHLQSFACMKPNDARWAGKRVLLREDWNEVRVPLMAHCLKVKFSDRRLHQYLIDTGQEELVHDAPWDNFWGNGKHGTGQNRLGQLLMDLRIAL